MSFEQPRRYTLEEFEVAAAQARDAFVEMREAQREKWAAFYDEAFDDARERAIEIMKRTEGFGLLSEAMGELLDCDNLVVLRYMEKPTISKDDFSVLSGTETNSISRLREPGNLALVASHIEGNLNDKVFPWVAQHRLPSDGEMEFAATAVAALVADQKTKTGMRNAPSKKQEDEVRDILRGRLGFATARARPVTTSRDFPDEGEVFDAETLVGGTKADVFLGLRDGRAMAIECKVSNSAVNSYKRLNHEVVDKAVRWQEKFGRDSMVTACVLQGLYRPENLVTAQKSGVAVFWSNNLEEFERFVRDSKR